MNHDPIDPHPDYREPQFPWLEMIGLALLFLGVISWVGLRMCSGTP